MTERKAKVPSKTTLKIRAIARVERLKDKIASAQDAEDVRLAKYIERIGRLETELKVAEEDLLRFNTGEVTDTETTSSVATSRCGDDGLALGGTD